MWVRIFQGLEYWIKDIVDWQWAANERFWAGFDTTQVDSIVEAHRSGGN